MRKAVSSVLSLALVASLFGSVAHAGGTGFDNNLVARVYDSNDVFLEFGNMLSSSSMEVEATAGYAQGWQWPWDSSLGVATTVATVDGALASSGKFSQKIVSSNMVSGEGIYNGQNVPATPGVTYTGSIKFNVPNISSARIYTRLVWEDSSDTVISMETSASDITSATSGWQEITVSGVAPANTDSVTLNYIIIGTSNGGSITAHIDDAVLTSSTGPQQFEVYRNATLIYSGTNHYFMDMDVLADTTPYTYRVEYADGSATPLGTDNIPVTVSGGSYNISSTVIGGNLEASFAPIAFSSVTIDNSAPTSSIASTTASVSDNRGSARGWSLKVGASDFISSPMEDPTSGGNAQYVLSIPIESVTMNVSSITRQHGQAIDSTHGPLGVSVPLTSSAQTLLSAAPGFGAGDYSATIGMSMVVPKVVNVVSISGTGSSYAPNDEVGIVSGVYSSTLIYTIGSGI